MSINITNNVKCVIIVIENKEGDTLLIAVLIFIILLYLVKVSNNKEVIKKNCKDDYDKANIKNAKKVYSHSKLSIILLVLFFTSLIVLLLCQFTSLEAVIIDYFMTDFYEEKALDYNLYLIPAYIIVCRGILIQVNLADYLFKYFKVEEEQIAGKELIKNILYKKKNVQVQKETDNNDNKTISDKNNLEEKDIEKTNEKIEETTTSSNSNQNEKQ